MYKVCIYIINDVQDVYRNFSVVIHDLIYTVCNGIFSTEQFQRNKGETLMSTSFDFNLSQSEVLRRLVLGMGMIGAVLVSPAVPSWIALVACYPVFTAMMQWDPVNVLLQKVADKFSVRSQNTLFVRSGDF